MLCVIAIILMVALDQIVKIWAINSLQPVRTIPIIEDVFHLTYVENRGAAFSIMQDQRTFFIISTIIILTVLIIAIKKEYFTHKIGYVSAYIIIAGALGNFIDRVRLGFVVDMFDFRLINFPVFNIADICVTVGAVFAAYYILFKHEDKPMPADEIKEENQWNN